jgi:hypothetical protein
LWDRAPSNNAAFFISAIGTYESSGKHATVMQAVNEALKENGGHLFKEAKGRKDPWESAFAERLAQIALDNRLRMSRPVYKNLFIYLIHVFQLHRKSLNEEVWENEYRSLF